MRLRLGLALLLCLHALPADAAEPLARRATLGAAVAPAPEGGPGALITGLAQGRPGDAPRLKPGDIITALNGAPVATPGDLVAALARIDGGREIELTARRGAATRRLRGIAAPRARETYRNGEAAYGETPFAGGRLRHILVTPPGGLKGPVVFLLQGYTCDSVEVSPSDAHAQLIEGLLARGISTFRIEKPGVGDSRGGPDCRDIDFETEVAAFQAGYRTLIDTLGAPPERIFLLGHSMGGLEAPLVAARGPAPRGVAVFGGVVRNWADYMLDVVKYQGFLADGGDPAEGEARGERLRPIIEAILIDGRAPSAVAAERADWPELMRANLEWDGVDRLYGRHYSFWSGLTRTRLLAAWRDTRSQVLTVYGESDFEALDAEDHKMIAEAVNRYRPGTARFIELPRTGHGMRLDGDRAAARAARAAADAPPAAFNGELVEVIAGWIGQALSRPPVAS